VGRPGDLLVARRLARCQTFDPGFDHGAIQSRHFQHRAWRAGESRRGRCHRCGATRPPASRLQLHGFGFGRHRNRGSRHLCDLGDGRRGSSRKGPARIAGNLYLTPLGYALFASPLKWGIILAPLALVFGLSFGIERLRPAIAQALFWLYAALIGVSLGSVFMIYTHTSVARVFFITAASFGALSLWGYTTRRDLTGLGSFLLMGLFGIIIAAFVNLFLASTALQWVISVVGVLVFSGLAAWDTQRLKREYIYGAMDGDTAERTAIMGALSLYLDFINLFTVLLQLLGERED
jgi:uncharacterized protein